MHSERLQYRNRTKALISEMLKTSMEEQLIFFGFDTETQLNEKLERIRKGLAKVDIDYTIFDLIDKSSQKVIGSCGFHNWIKEHNRAEIGYEVFPNYQNQGFMTEATKIIIEYGFNRMDLNRIEALVSPNNIASQKVILKNGFIKEGLLRKHYKVGIDFKDNIIYSLLRDS